MNVSEKGFVAVIDSRNLVVTKRYPVQCRSPHGLSCDAANDVLLIGCRDGFIALNASTGRLAGETVICPGVDAGGFDPESRLVFESCPEGVVSVVRQIKPNFYALVGTIPTQLWARTMIFDSKTKRVYLSTADYEIFPKTNPNDPYPFRGAVKPETFRVLVMGKE